MPTTRLLDQVVTTKNNVATTYYISGSVVYGYFNESNGKFYSDDIYTTEVTGRNGLFYVTLDTDYIYRYSETDTEFVQIGGSGNASAAIQYVNSLPVVDIEDVIYGTTTRTAYQLTVTDGFLDANELFIRTDETGGEYIYTAKEGIVLEASLSDTGYLPFDSLAFDGTDWILTVNEGGTTLPLSDGDIFYFRWVQDLFYAGNAEDQKLIPFASSNGTGGSAYFPGEGIAISNNIISVTPASPSTLGGVKPDNTTIEITANGTLKGNYQGGYGIQINNNQIATKTFIGTQADWSALTPTEQATFDTVSITDDGTTINNTPGHTIQNNIAAFPQRTNLKFADATIADDSTNDMTIVTHTPYTAGDKIDITNHVVSCDDTVKGTFIGTRDEWNILSTTDKAKYDIVNITDDEITPAAVVDAVVDGNMNAVTSNAVADAINWKMVEVTGDGVKTYTELLNEIATQIGNNPGRFKESKMVISSYTYHNSRDNNYFHSITGTTSAIYILFVYLATTGSIFTQCMSSAAGNTITNLSSNVVSNGAKIQYYYKE